MLNWDSSSPTVRNCTFSGNSAAGTAGVGGGMANVSGSNPRITNCTFSGNSASHQGGAMSNWASAPTVTNCTFSGNSADQGGAVYSDNGSNQSYGNSIIWGNAATEGNQIYNGPGGTATLSYSCYADGANDIVPGGGFLADGTCITSDPLFAAPEAAALAPTTAGNYRLGIGSPAVDTGSNAAVPAGVTTDLDGNPRTVDGNGDGTATVDMGAFEQRTPPVVADQTFDVAENTAVGVRVGTVLATDVDAGDVLTYAITGGNEAATFALDGATGVLTVSGPLDYEALPRYTLTVAVTDLGGLRDTATVTVDVTDVNEAPHLADVEWLGIREDAAPETVVGQAIGADQDGSAPNNVLRYAITAGNAGAVFTVDSATGLVAVARPLDFERDAEYTLTVTVTDEGTPPLLASASVRIGIADVNEPPVVNPAVFGVAENTGVGAVVGRVSASDPDRFAPNNVLTLAITAGNESSAFGIDPATGLITVAGPLDFGAHATYELSVTATDGGIPVLSGTATVTVQVGDVNLAPAVADAEFAVREDAAVGTEVGQVLATDPDPSAPNNVLNYAIVSGNLGEAFAIDAASGRITVARGLDYESVAEYVLTVTVTDGGTPALADAAVVRVQVGDVNEAPMVAGAVFTVAESPAVGVFVGQVHGTDPDLTEPNNLLRYAITAGDTGNVFAIDAATGQLRTALPLDYELVAAYQLTVTASDGGDPALSGSATVTVQVRDVNEPPAADDAVFAVAEDAAVGSMVGRVSANDPDRDAPNSVLAYAITSGNGDGVFAIDAGTGELTLAQALNREARDSYLLTVTVTDGGNPALWDTATVTVTVTDVNEAPTAAGATFTVAEDAPPGTEVGRIAATDPDASAPFNTLSYAMTGGNESGAFAVDPGTGAVRVAGPLDFETRNEYALAVTVSDGGVPSLSAEAAITIQVTNVDEPTPAPEIRIEPAAPRTDDDLTVVIVRQPPDPDGDPVLGYTYRWTRLTARESPTEHNPLDKANTRRGDLWQVTVRARTNPTGVAEVVSPLAAEAQVRILNTPPTFAEAAVRPATAYESLAVECRGWSDPDADAEAYRYQWIKGDVPIPGATDATLAAGQFAAGDTIACVVTAWDGEELGRSLATQPFVVPASGEAWVFALALTGADLTAVHFGMQREATDGIDRDIDVIVPPESPAGNGHAYLMDDDGVTYATDLRAWAATKSWLLVVDAGPSDVVLSWNAGNVPAGQCLTLQRVDGDQRPLGVTVVNMARTSSLSVRAGEVQLFRIHLGWSEQSLVLNSGWNLISLPLEPGNASAAVILAAPGGRSGATVYLGPIWAWRDGRYVEVDELQALEGYWVYVPTATEITLVGAPLESTSRVLPHGWNLVGPAAPMPAPKGTGVGAPCWAWQGPGYVPAIALVPTKAYWLFIMDALLPLDLGE